MTYDLCKKLIKRGKAALVSKNLELYHLCGRISDTEYKELAELIKEGESDE